MMNKLLAVILFLSSTMAFGQNGTITETHTWTSVPIAVDTETYTYTVEGKIPEGTNEYYYSYEGHRCFTEKQSVSTVKVITFSSKVQGGETLYCYSERE